MELIPNFNSLIDEAFDNLKGVKVSLEVTKKAIKASITGIPYETKKVDSINDVVHIKFGDTSTPLIDADGFGMTYSKKVLKIGDEGMMFTYK